MNESVVSLKKGLKAALTQIAAERGLSEPSEDLIDLERPRDEGHGDWATNLAMKCAKAFGMKPRDLAERLVELIDDRRHVQSMEVAGPGFINFRLTHQWMNDLVAQIESQGGDYGRSNLGQGRRVQVEFVSANPTGPLHVGHGRGAAVGDTVGNILAFVGWEVQKEYYVNDAGLQMNILGRSIQSRYFELLGKPELAPFDDEPGKMYKGDYIYDEAQKIIDTQEDRFLSLPLDESVSFFGQTGAAHILEGIKADLKRFGVHFDQFYFEKSLYEKELVPQSIAALREKGYVYESEGAQWFRSTEFGDDKDRVLFRSKGEHSGGEPTYFASDVAYHKEKFDRGFNRVIDVWGCDHHGYVPRLKAAIKAMGREPDDFDVLLIQLVTLIKGGQVVRMSTRAGEFVTLDWVLDEVGVDATRYYFLMRRSDSPLDFDMDQATRESSDNPVYYLQYAYARIASLMRKAAERGLDPKGPLAFDGELITTQEEKRLLTALAAFPDEIVRAAQGLEPHLLVNYAHELAVQFHGFYNSCRILEEENQLQSTHLALARAVRTVLTTCFRLLGVSAPERM